MVLAPLELPVGTVIDRFALDVTAFTANSVLRFACFAEGDDGYPGAVLGDATATSAVGQIEATASVTTTTSIVYIGVAVQTAASTIRTIVGPPLVPLPHTTAALAAGSTVRGGTYSSGITGALAANPTITTVVAARPAVAFRIAWAVIYWTGSAFLVLLIGGSFCVETILALLWSGVHPNPS
jgi:hypothetical protein